MAASTWLLPRPTLAAPTEGNARYQRLFEIERSKNKNRVIYDLRITETGTPHPEKPVAAYWIMYAEHGQREELTWLEKQLAYGHEVVSEVSPTGFWMRLQASQARPIRVARVDGHFCAVMQINGVRSVLERISVKSDENGTLPKVLYVELVGRDVDTSQRLVERLKA